jgi:hypothetical protein
MIPSVASSQIRGLSANRIELINQQKEASFALQQINAEYNDLEKKYKKREKDAKIEIENRRKLDDLKIRHKELEKHFKNQDERNRELGDYEKDVQVWEEKIKNDEFKEQLAKEKDDMQMCIRSLQRQSHLTKERINHRNKRTAMLQDLTKDEEPASRSKINMEEQQETYKYAKQLEKLLRETALAKTKANEIHYLAISRSYWN